MYTALLLWVGRQRPLWRKPSGRGWSPVHSNRERNFLALVSNGRSGVSRTGAAGCQRKRLQARGARIRVWRMRRAPAVPDSRWSGLHARVGEGRAPTHPLRGASTLSKSGVSQGASTRTQTCLPAWDFPSQGGDSPTLGEIPWHQHVKSTTCQSLILFQLSKRKHDTSTQKTNNMATVHFQCSCQRKHKT